MADATSLCPGLICLAPLGQKTIQKSSFQKGVLRSNVVGIKTGNNPVLESGSIDRFPPIRFAQVMENEEYQLAPAVRQRVRRKLKTWYDGAARELPWRATHDPYRIWISEIMLQQTTVAAVIPYYERFFQAFPHLEDLAQAEEQQVLKLWEGLGYYSRARNILKTARLLWREYEGQFPTDVSGLQELPGIGRYTAGAIVSFAFDRKAPILEANTLRLYSRLVGYPGNPRSADGQRILWNFAEDILSSHSPGQTNQALMELGSRICTPKEPNCPTCPLNRECRAFAEGTQHEIPHRPERIALTDVIEISIAVEKDGAYLLRRRQPGERWAGLWDFPRFELAETEVNFTDPLAAGNGRLVNPSLASDASARLQSLICELTGIQAETGSFLTEFRHGVTRSRIHLLC
ncbi:MAG: A/G-specific adenine glycosylase, partial [Planctomycetaceae bacterium]|nr:A/G-specific adenine glycosylase [Planctomycetaceae bacterium]